jgi:hypothetical protein
MTTLELLSRLSDEVDLELPSKPVELRAAPDVYDRLRDEARRKLFRGPAVLTFWGVPVRRDEALAVGAWEWSL